jgi:pantothenate kinase
MAEHLTLAALTDALLVAKSRRRIVAIAGSPGSGKSTIAESLKERMNASRPGYADILPMDGYHFDDAVLNARGHRARKGAPHTFDLDGFRVMLERLRTDDGRDVAVPVFDRSIEIARAGARIIAGGTRVILAEGNYFLLDEPGWRDLAPLFDLTVMVEASEDLLGERLNRRWEGFGYAPDAIAEKMEGNDLPNMRLVLTRSRLADVVVRSDAS